MSRTILGLYTSVRYKPWSCRYVFSRLLQNSYVVMRRPNQCAIFNIAMEVNVNFKGWLKKVLAMIISVVREFLSRIIFFFLKKNIKLCKSALKRKNNNISCARPLFYFSTLTVRFSSCHSRQTKEKEELLVRVEDIRTINC